MEIVVQDVVGEQVDPTGKLLTILLDVTLPALFQQSIDSRNDVYKGARKAKTKDFPSRSCINVILVTTRYQTQYFSLMVFLINKRSAFPR